MTSDPEAAAAFAAAFSDSADGRWDAPGRVNLIGEHTDYNRGYALPIALPQVVRCYAAVRAGDRVRVASQQYPGEVVDASIAELGLANIDGWARYPLGVVHEFVRRGHSIGGIDLLLDSDLPIGAGVSSSAAVECSVALAVSDLFSLGTTREELVDIAHTAENFYVGAPTGKLDQSAAMHCTTGHAMLLDFADDHRTQVPFDLAERGLALLIIDTMTKHELAAGAYAERRSECERAAALLGVGSLREVTNTDDLAGLPTLLERRARHVVTENARVLAIADALTTRADPRIIGPMLAAGHASLRDDFEVSTPELDTAVDVATAAGAHGARLVGGGFGGSVIALVEVADVAAIDHAVTAAFRSAGFADPRTLVAAAAAAARRVR